MVTIVIILAAFIGVAALVGGVALIFKGESASPVEDRLQMLASGGGTGASKDAAKAEAKLLARPLNDVPNLLEETFSRILNLRLFIEQAGITLEPTKFLLVAGGAAVVGAVLWLFTGLTPVISPVAAVTLGALPFIWLWMKRRSRLKKFGKQLPEALDLIARALRAGHSLGSGFQLVAKEMADPIGKEFARCYEEQNFGIPLEEALEDMCDRVPNLDLRFFATAVILQRQTGGDLAEILDKIGHLIRERFKIWGQIQALTGEGRLSGIVLLALPPILFVVMYRLNQDYVMMLFEDPLGQQMLAGAAVMQVIGALVIRKIINIKV